MTPIYAIITPAVSAIIFLACMLEKVQVQEDEHLFI